MENTIVMTDKRKIIDLLRKVYAEKNYSYDKIIALAEKNGEHISKSTLSRLFTEGSTDYNFKYEETLRPIVDVLLDVENMKMDDSLDTMTMKSILKYKIDRIEELEDSLQKEKFARELLEQELEQARRSIEFLKEQVVLKDQRITSRDKQIDSLLSELINCPKRKECL